jgi:hypothetical protein
MRRDQLFNSGAWSTPATNFAGFVEETGPALHHDTALRKVSSYLIWNVRICTFAVSSFSFASHRTTMDDKRRVSYLK